MNEQDEALKRLLQRAAPGPADCEPKRDLWPEMLQRLERPRVQIPWGDWAIAAVLFLCLVLFPETILPVLYLF